MPVQAERETAPHGRREAILEAALECFSRQGFSATTIADVRRRSGASVGSIYHHFASKEELAAALHVEAVSRYQTGLAAAIEATPTAREGVAAAVTYHLRWIVANESLARYMVARQEREVLRLAEARLRRLNSKLTGRIGAWIEPHVRAGELRELPHDVFYALLLGPAQELGRLWLGRRATTHPRDASADLAAAAWQVLKTNERSTR